jgi:hypothetical protein
MARCWGGGWRECVIGTLHENAQLIYTYSLRSSLHVHCKRHGLWGELGLIRNLSYCPLQSSMQLLSLPRYLGNEDSHNGTSLYELTLRHVSIRES